MIHVVSLKEKKSLRWEEFVKKVDFKPGEGDMCPQYF